MRGSRLLGAVTGFSLILCGVEAVATVRGGSAGLTRSLARIIGCDSGCDTGGSLLFNPLIQLTPVHGRRLLAAATGSSLTLRGVEAVATVRGGSAGLTRTLATIIGCDCGCDTGGSLLFNPLTGALQCTAHA